MAVVGWKDLGWAYAIAAVAFLVLPIADIETTSGAAPCRVVAPPVYDSGLPPIVVQSEPIEPVERLDSDDYFYLNNGGPRFSFVESWGPPPCGEHVVEEKIAPLAVLSSNPPEPPSWANWSHMEAASPASLAFTGAWFFLLSSSVVLPYRQYRQDWHRAGQWLLRPHGPRIWLMVLGTLPMLTLGLQKIVGWGCRGFCGHSVVSVLRRPFSFLGSFGDAVVLKAHHAVTALFDGLRIELPEWAIVDERWWLEWPYHVWPKEAPLAALFLSWLVVAATWYLLGAPLANWRAAMNRPWGRPSQAPLLPRPVHWGAAGLVAGLVPFALIDFGLIPPYEDAQGQIVEHAGQLALFLIAFSFAIAGAIGAHRIPVLLYAVPSMVFLVNRHHKFILPWVQPYAGLLLGSLFLGTVAAMMWDGWTARRRAAAA